MAIIELFSKRQKKLRGDTLDVYTYDNIPQKLRVQIVHIIRDCIGVRKQYSENNSGNAYEEPVVITLSYNYRQEVSKSITINKV